MIAKIALIAGITTAVIVAVIVFAAVIFGIIYGLMLVFGWLDSFWMDQ